VQEIIDGDTIKVSIGHDFYTVRMIGMDTPEDVDPDTPDECHGQEAAAYLASVIPVKTLVYLETDVSDTDRYDRLLRSVWVEQGEGRYRLVQDQMVRDGYAIAKVYRPDVEYAEFLAEAQTVAENAGLGLWSACGGADTPLNQPAPTPTPAAGNAGMGIASGGSCDPAYPDVCIPPVSQVGDLDCADISYRWFVVLPPDPHNFDGDHDGYGCQS
jgi:micrococcal nuclease